MDKAHVLLRCQNSAFVLVSEPVRATAFVLLVTGSIPAVLRVSFFCFLFVYSFYYLSAHHYRYMWVDSESDSDGFYTIGSPRGSLRSAAAMPAE